MDNNAYVQAILAVGTTLEYYDADKVGLTTQWYSCSRWRGEDVRRSDLAPSLTTWGSCRLSFLPRQSFPVYGFGGRVGNYVSHCFALNGNDAAPEVADVQGILRVSQSTFFSMWPGCGLTLSIHVMSARQLSG